MDSATISKRRNTAPSVTATATAAAVAAATHRNSSPTPSAPQDPLYTTSALTRLPASIPLDIFCCNTVIPIQLVKNSLQATTQLRTFLIWANENAESQPVEARLPYPSPHIVEVCCIDPANDPADMYGEYQGSGRWFGIEDQSPGSFSQEDNITFENGPPAYTEIYPSKKLLQIFKQIAVFGMSCVRADHSGMWYEISILVADREVFPSVSADDSYDNGNESDDENSLKLATNGSGVECPADRKQDASLEDKQEDCSEEQQDAFLESRQPDTTRRKSKRKNKNKNATRRATEEGRKRDNERRKEQRKKAQVAKKGGVVEEEVVKGQNDVEQAAGISSSSSSSAGWGGWMCTVL